MGPLKLEPVYLQSIWAGNNIARIRGMPCEKIGIWREVCTYPGSENTVASGSRQGQTITQLIKTCGEQIMGRTPGSHLVRVAYMDTAEDLSVQVHPDQAHAASCGDFEKSEAWYIVEAKEGASITAGLKTDDKEVVKKAILQNQLETLLIRTPVKEGDFVMIPAGMVHACGKQILALEIGSFGGITYRLYDYGRDRELHLEKALEVMKPSLRTQVIHVDVRDVNCPERVGQHELFRVDVVDVSGEWTYTGYESYRILTCVKGSETIVIPSCCSELQIRGRARLIISCGQDGP